MSHRRLPFSGDPDHACGGNWTRSYTATTTTTQDTIIATTTTTTTSYHYHHSLKMMIGIISFWCHPFSSSPVHGYVRHDWWWVWDVIKDDWISYQCCSVLSMTLSVNGWMNGFTHIWTVMNKSGIFHSKNFLDWKSCDRYTHTRVTGLRWMNVASSTRQLIAA